MVRTLKHRFFRNIGAICAFAFYGTVVSCAAVGLIMWGTGAMGFSYGLTLIEALVFGAIISTTDTVCIYSHLHMTSRATPYHAGATGCDGCISV